MGTALAIAPGTSTITVIVDDASDTIRIEATESPIGTIEVGLVESDLLVGDTSQLTVRVRDAFGAERSIGGVEIVSQSPAVARVDPDTLRIYAVGAGDADVVVSARPPIANAVIEQRVRVRISPRLVVRLEASPPVLDVMRGDLASITVRAVDRRGRESADAVIRWTSDATGVALVDAGGAVRTLDVGSALLQASCHNNDGSVVDVRIPVRVRGASIQRPVLTPAVTLPDVAPAAPPLAQSPLPTATALFAAGSPPAAKSASAPPAPLPSATATKKDSSGRSKANYHATSDGAAIAPVDATLVPAHISSAPPKASNRIPLFAGVAVVAVAAIVWLVRPTGADRAQDVDVGPDAVQVEGLPPAAVDVPPIAPPVAEAQPPNTPFEQSTAPVASPRESGPEPTPPPRSNQVDGRRSLPKQPPVSPPRQGDRVAITSGTLADASPRSVTSAETPPPIIPPLVAPAPVSVEPVAEVPSPSEIQREVYRLIDGVRRTRGAGTPFAEFWKDGGQHRVELDSAPRMNSESRVNTQAQFTIRLQKINSGGRTDRFIAQAALDVTKKNGQVSLGPVKFGALIPTKK